MACCKVSAGGPYCFDSTSSFYAYAKNPTGILEDYPLS